MFKLIVLCALLSIAAARPGLLAPSAILAPAPALVAAPLLHSIPAAISHQSHVQLHARPLITSVVAPALPLLHAAPLATHAIAAPIALGHGHGW